MLQNFFQICLFSMLYVIINFKYGVSQESSTAKLFRDFCEEKSDYFRNLGDYICENGLKYIEKLTFNDIKYLPASAFQGLSIHFLALDDPGVTVDEEIFDGIVKLKEFFVKRSSIKVNYFTYLRTSKVTIFMSGGKKILKQKYGIPANTISSHPVITIERKKKNYYHPWTYIKILFSMFCNS